MENSLFLFPPLHGPLDNMNTRSKIRPDPERRLMDQVRQLLRYHHYADKTEQTCTDWIVRYVKQNPPKIHDGNARDARQHSHEDVNLTQRENTGCPSARA